jgi:hypothetical protein
MSGQPYPKSAQVPVNRKKYRRVVASRKQWEALRAERLGPCLLCAWLGGPQAFPSSLHHVVPRDRFGDDVAENLVPLCGDGTTGHHGLIEAGDGDVCRAFAEMLPHFAEDSYAYATQKMGDDGFLRLYRVRFEAA